MLPLPPLLHPQPPLLQLPLLQLQCPLPLLLLQCPLLLFLLRCPLPLLLLRCPLPLLLLKRPPALLCLPSLPSPTAPPSHLALLGRPSHQSAWPTAAAAAGEGAGTQARQQQLRCPGQAPVPPRHRYHRPCVCTTLRPQTTLYLWPARCRAQRQRMQPECERCMGQPCNCMDHGG